MTALVMDNIVPMLAAAAGKVSHGCRLFLGDLLELFFEVQTDKKVPLDLEVWRSRQVSKNI